MQPDRPRILIIDDDPYHLEIYGLLVNEAGYDAVPALVRFADVESPLQDHIALILLDYQLNSQRPTSDLARELRTQYPETPILLLSDVWSLPAEMAPYVSGFVRKGDPARLLSTMRKILPRRS
ncbi:MAG TPA: response regulator [Terracidiphilus sp.]|nr:response regulator [Terracidiphilus sp.]